MARLCENPAGCTRAATNTVPRFMGSVWLCPGCALADAEPDCMPDAGTVRVGSYVRVPDLGAAGVVRRITRSGQFVVEYWRGGMRLAFRDRSGIVLV